MSCTAKDCSRKTGLIIFVCRCKKEFCIKHRMPEIHNCDFDYKTEQRKLLEKQNELIAPQKILKI